jgi:hypothetical protein
MLRTSSEAASTPDSLPVSRLAKARKPARP